MAPFVQGPPGGGLGAGGGPGLAPLHVVIAGAAGVLDRHGILAGRRSGIGRPDPQRAGIQRSAGVWFALGAGRAEFGGSGVAGGGAGGGTGPFGALGGADQGGDGLVADLGGIGVAGDEVQGVQVVPGDDVGDFFPVAGEGLAQVRGDGQVASLAVPAGQGVVGDLAQHVLGELVAAPLGRQRVRGYGQHLAAHQVSQGGARRRLVAAGDRDQRLGGERGTEHSGVGHEPPHTGVQHIQPGGQQRVQAVRHGQLADVADQPVDAFLRLDDVPVDQRPNRFDREQRHALGLAGDLRPGRFRHPRHQRVDQLVHRLRIERVQGQRDPVAADPELGPGLGQFRPGEDQHVNGQVLGPVDQVVQEVQQAAVGVLGVLDQQHDRRLSRQPLEEQPPPGEQLLSGEGGRAVGRAHAQQPAQPDAHVRPLLRIREEPVQAGGQLAGRDVGGVLLGDAQPLPDHLGQSPERDALAVRQASAPMPPHLLGHALDVLAKLPAQPGLTGAGRA